MPELNPSILGNPAAFFLRRSALVFVGRTLLIALFFHAVTLVNAQVVNHSAIHISNKGQLHIVGSVANGGVIINNGLVSATGDWKNEKVYQGSGVISLNGVREQNLNNNGQSIGSLVVDGGGSKMITGKVSIDKTLTLNHGLVSVSIADTLLLSQDAKILGGSSQSYINGPLVTVGNGYKFFPVGKAGHYAPVELVDIKGINPRIQLEALTDFPSVDIAEGSAYCSIYWEVKPIKGVFNGSITSLNIAEEIENHDDLIIMSADDDMNFKLHKDVEVQSHKVMSELEISDKYLLLGRYVPIPVPRYYLSRSLSPNAIQEQNRSVKIFGEELQPDAFIFQVFSRTGNLMFESTSLESMSSEGWSGRKFGTGELLAAGAYPFILKAKTLEGRPVIEKGVISLIR